MKYGLAAASLSAEKQGLTILFANDRNKLRNGKMSGPSFDEEESLKTPESLSDMIDWMKIALDILLFIEEYELDTKLTNFFLDQKYLKYFDENIFQANF